MKHDADGSQDDGHGHAGVEVGEVHDDGRQPANITLPTAQPQHAALSHLERFVAGIDDPASADWLRRGFLAYLRAAGAVPLTRCLRLPGTAKATARMLRDRALVDAAQRLPLPQAASVWQRAQALHAVIGQSHVTRSRAHRTGKLPWHAGAAVVALVQAERVAGALPTTARQLLTILQASEAERQCGFADADAA